MRMTSLFEHVLPKNTEVWIIFDDQYFHCHTSLLRPHSGESQCSIRKDCRRSKGDIIRRGCRHDKPPNHMFDTRFVKGDFKLVALNADDGAIAEFLVEHALADHKS